MPQIFAEKYLGLSISYSKIPVFYGVYSAFIGEIRGLFFFPQMAQIFAEGLFGSFHFLRQKISFLLCLICVHPRNPRDIFVFSRRCRRVALNDSDF
jgi:hypothetical protein